jgi:hypothetical protein
LQCVSTYFLLVVEFLKRNEIYILNSIFSTNPAFTIFL